MPLITPISKNRLNLTRITDYFAADDYHSEGGRTHGFWCGRLAEECGLTGTCDTEVLQKILSGELPSGRPKLLKDCGYDLTFCADKSYSIAALVWGEDIVLEWHRQAVREAVNFAEQFVGAKNGKINNVSQSQVTGNFIAAAFEHKTSRAGDPHLHTHVVVANVTQRADGQLRAIDATLLYKKQKIILAQYHAAMARQAQLSGLDVHNAALYSYVPRLSCIKTALINEYSQSTHRITDALEGARKHLVSAGKRAAIAKKVRAKKQAFELQELVKNWRQRMGLHKWLGKTSLKSHAERRFAERIAGLLQNDMAMAGAVDGWVRQAIAHLSERNSVFHDDDFVLALMRFSQGLLAPREAMRLIYQLLDNGQLVRGEKLKHYLTTPALIAETREILHLCRQNEGYAIDAGYLSPPLILQAINRYQLGEDQKLALSRAISNPAQIMALCGYAGTGKTTMLAAVRDVAEKIGWQVRGIAPTKKSVAGLHEAEIRDAKTIARWLTDKRFVMRPRTLLVVDECSLVSSKAMLKILQHATKNNAKILLIGDPSQYQAVERGRPFDAILAGTAIPRMKLDTIRRQNTENMQRMAKLAQTDTAAATGEIQVVEKVEADAQYDAAAQHYVRNNHNAIILTGTHNARLNINRAVRQKLQLEGKGVNITALRKRNLTRANLSLMEEYQVGDYIVLSKEYKRLSTEKNSPLQIVRKWKNQQGETEIHCRDANRHTHHTINISLLSKRFVSLYRGEKTEIAVGDLLYHEDLNTREARFLKVAAIDDDCVKCKDSNNKLLTLKKGAMHHVMHGYAMTGMKFQGATVDRVIAHKPSIDQTTHHRSMYTDLTRAREEAIIITDDLSELQAALRHKPYKICVTDAVEINSPATNRRAERHHRGNEIENE